MFNKSILQLILSSFLLTFSFWVFAEESIDMEGLSIIGNKELPNVLYIVPWKSPELPDMTEPPLSTLIDEALEPIDRESVLRRELYYKVIQSTSAPVDNQVSEQQ
jgi:hypothetical protein